MCLIVVLGFDFPLQSTRTQLLTRYSVTPRRLPDSSGTLLLVGSLLVGNPSCRAEPSLDGFPPRRDPPRRKYPRHRAASSSFPL
jgi:hypothetical protein